MYFMECLYKCDIRWGELEQEVQMESKATDVSENDAPKDVEQFFLKKRVAIIYFQMVS